MGEDHPADLIRDRAGIDPDSALADVGAVFATLREAVSPGELKDIASQLPEDLRGLLGTTR